MTVWYIGLVEEDGRFRAIDEHEAIPRRAALGLNHYPALLAAARAVVETWDAWMATISPNRPTVRDLETVMDTLRAAVEAAVGGEEEYVSA